MISLLNNILPILPILILIISIIIIFFISFFDNKTSLGAIVVISAILLSIFSVLCSKHLLLHYFSEFIRLDQHAYRWILMLLISSLCTCLFSCSWLTYDDTAAIEFYFFILLATIGGILVAISFHFFTLFLGLELLFLPVLGILSFFSKLEKNLFSVMIYTILSIFSSALLLLGFSFVYFATGRLCFSFLSYFFLYYPSIMMGNILLLGICIIFLSLFFKLSLFPLHTWSPDIYQNSSSCSLIFFSTVTKLSIFSFLIHIFNYFPYINKIYPLFLILNIVSLFSVIFGNIAAIMQDNIQRLIGYTSISNLGFLLIILLNSSCKDYALVSQHIYIYLISYTLGLIGFFGIKSIVDFNTLANLNSNIAGNSFTGLFRRDCILGAALTIILLSLSGFPVTFGFWGKFFIFKYLMQKKYFLLTALIMVSSMIGMQSYLRIMFSLYNKPIDENTKLTINNNYFIYRLQKLLIICISLILIILGFFPNFIHVLI
ncbi:NADH-quinone oxidoreductase subunit N [Buchnera aphidicola]|uniref:NADH-quinone oxidoreductase subunit N n=1 Tax=Buchnera aphidicola TaxID=9 RepID=UPI00094CA029|nr:proton-conducting transporter membrane subunit [Buchnera aphidicola]